MAGSAVAQSVPLPSAQVAILACMAAVGGPFVVTASGAGERISVPVAPGQPLAPGTLILVVTIFVASDGAAA